MNGNTKFRGGIASTAVWGFSILALLVGAAFIACDKDDDGDGGGGVTKPTALATDGSVTAAQAEAKLDEIITYCDAHSGATNDGIKAGAQGMKTGWSTYSNAWTTMGTTAVTGINTYISTLQ